jgi:hypothetical protein
MKKSIFRKNLRSNNYLKRLKLSIKKNNGVSKNDILANRLLKLIKEYDNRLSNSEILNAIDIAKDNIKMVGKK